MILFCVCLAHARQQGLGTPVATGVALSTDSIKPLQIGDSIPSALWNLPLQIIKARQEGTTTVTLNDYKGKLIILDFWATWCASCIKYMPHMHEVARELRVDVVLLPSTHERLEVVQSFLAKTASPQMQSLKASFTSIIASNTLNDYFPRKTIPHVVIIGADGTVKAITLPAYTTVDNLKMLSEKKLGHIVSKQESVDKPLLGLKRPDSNHENKLYYTALIPYQDGLLFPTGFTQDSINNTNHMFYVNATVLKLYTFALQYLQEAGTNGLAYMPSRRILAVSNPKSYEYSAERNADYDHQRMRYTYEALMPGHISKQLAQQKMKEELDYYLNLTGSYEKREVPCLILGIDKESKLPKSKGGEQKIVLNGIWGKKVPEKVKPSSGGANSYMQNYRLSQLAYLLNHQTEGTVPFVIDETGIEFPLDLDLPDKLYDIAQLKSTLKKQGISLKETVRELPMFVLKEKGYEPQGDLRLGRFGYVYGDQTEEGRDAK
jgi:thiol-disulfide isomerase/thioredoxin